MLDYEEFKEAVEKISVELCECNPKNAILAEDKLTVSPPIKDDPFGGYYIPDPQVEEDIEKADVTQGGIWSEVVCLSSFPHVGAVRKYVMKRLMESWKQRKEEKALLSKS